MQSKIVDLAQNTVLKQENTFRWLDIQFLIIKTLFSSLTASFTNLETKQIEWLQFYATIVISLVGCAFWGSDECTPSMPCIFFYLPLSGKN